MLALFSNFPASRTLPETFTRSRCWCHASTACRTQSNWEPNSDQQGGIVWLIGSDRNLGRKQAHTKDNYKKAITLNSRLKKNGKSGHPCLSPNLRGEAVILSSLIILLFKDFHKKFQKFTL
nr:uncharacterized protein LOC129457592 [Symphalangus syndactylus]